MIEKILEWLIRNLGTRKQRYHRALKEIRSWEARLIGCDEIVALYQFQKICTKWDLDLTEVLNQWEPK